jgi:hypothetical protein
MADLIVSRKLQSLNEVREWDFDFTNDLIAGVTVVSAIATHIPPSGSASIPKVGRPVGNIVPVTFGPLTVKGTHYLDCLATLSDGEVSDLMVAILVKY